VYFRGRLMIESAPHEWLFLRMAAVVHHGGAGTTGAGLRAGVPNPFKGDQPFWGKRVQDLGAGTPPIPHRRLTPDALANAIRRAMDDQTMREQATSIGEKIRAEDDVGNAVRLMQQIAAKPPEPVALV
jgi:sterol 3beta-glucosyltransferase